MTIDGASCFELRFHVFQADRNAVALFQVRLETIDPGEG